MLVYINFEVVSLENQKVKLSKIWYLFMKIETVLGSNIKAKRKKLGLTQAQLAEAIDVSIPTIQSAERDSEEWPSLETLKRLSSFFKCSTSELFQVPRDDKVISISEKKLQDTVDSLKEIINAASLPNCPRDIFEKLAKIKSDNSQFWEILDSSLEAESEIEDEEKRDVVKKKFG